MVLSDIGDPTELGGLVVLDIKRMGWALRARWSWLKCTDASKPWRNFPIKTNKHIDALVHAATKVHLGNDTNVLFWSDCWIEGQSITDLAPGVVAAVSQRAVCSRKVASSLSQNAWVNDMSGALSADALDQFLDLAELLSTQHVSEAEDSFFWNFSTSGEYTTKSAYSALFEGITNIRIMSPSGSVGRLSDAKCLQGSPLLTAAGMRNDVCAFVCPLMTHVLFVTKSLNPLLI